MTSVRFEELERRCKRLQKIRILWTVFILVMVFLGVFALFYSFYTPQTSPQQESVTVTVPVVHEESSKISSEMNSSVVLMEEENKTVEQKTADVEELLFLAPKIRSNNLQLPKEEAQAAKRLLAQEQTLLNAFKAKATFENAIALAQFYFEGQAYSEVVCWAKEASRYNSKSEKPWLLYAKAKFHLGEREESIRSLELFLSYIQSKEAQELLKFYKGQE